MAKWAVTTDNKWGSFAGTINPTVTIVNAHSYGEAIERASRKLIEDMFKVTAEEIKP
jgi:hypothetical protein